MQLQSDGKAYDDINITPMLDLAYVLLVIFIIMTTATVQGMKVNLPKASAAPSLAAQTTKAVTISNDGKIFLDTIPVTLSELEQRLVQQRTITPEFPIVVRLGTVAIERDRGPHEQRHRSDRAGGARVDDQLVDHVVGADLRHRVPQRDGLRRRRRDAAAHDDPSVDDLAPPRQRPPTQKFASGRRDGERRGEHGRAGDGGCAGARRSRRRRRRWQRRSDGGGCRRRGGTHRRRHRHHGGAGDRGRADARGRGSGGDAGTLVGCPVPRPPEQRGEQQAHAERADDHQAGAT